MFVFTVIHRKKGNDITNKCDYVYKHKKNQGTSRINFHKYEVRSDQTIN